MKTSLAPRSWRLSFLHAVKRRSQKQHLRMTHTYILITANIYIDEKKGDKESREMHISLVSESSFAIFFYAFHFPPTYTVIIK